MLSITVMPHIEGNWQDLPEKMSKGQVIDLTDDHQVILEIARVTRGMRTGASSVILRIDLPDGQVVLAQTSLKLFLDSASFLADIEKIEQEEKQEKEERN